jgi:hypothetical protein
MLREINIINKLVDPLLKARGNLRIREQRFKTNWSKTSSKALWRVGPLRGNFVNGGCCYVTPATRMKQ